MFHLITILVVLLRLGLGAPLPSLNTSTLVARNSLTCNACGYAVATSTLAQAVDLFCSSHNGVTLDISGTQGLPSYSEVITYAPTPGSAEQGRLVFQMAALATDCPALSIDYDTCLYDFSVSVNECNGLGGVWYSPCLEFVLTTNPNGC